MKKVKFLVKIDGVWDDPIECRDLHYPKFKKEIELTTEDYQELENCLQKLIDMGLIDNYSIK